MMQTVVRGPEIYSVGDTVGLAVRFGTEDEPIEPNRVEVRVRDPKGRTAQLTYGKDPGVVRVARGEYQVVVVATVPGRWQYRFVGLGLPLRRAEHDGFFDVFDVGTEEPS
jgi:hypothetical protein